MFKPWVGTSFGDTSNLLRGRRLLVLGESHHAEEYPVGSIVPEMTCDVVSTYLDQSAPRHPWMRTFSVVTGFVARQSSSELSPDERKRIWDSIAFYNFVPVTAAAYARQRPSAAHFDLGTKPLHEVLSGLKIEAVAVMGKDLSGWVARGEGLEKPWDQSEYLINGVPAVRFPHPSTAFRYAQCWPLLNDLVGPM
jgi:hypothetical protein